MDITAIDLFCGVGGLTHGLIKAGLNVVAGVDIEPSCKFAYETNNHALFINEDITTIKASELEKYYSTDCIRVLVGCAPCQPFSKYSSRYRKNGHNDGKWKLLSYFQNIAKEILPDIISIENVPNLVHEQVFLDFLEELRKLEYSYDWQIVYCPDYGVPQKRKRLVLLASKLGAIKMIDPLYSENNYKTVRMAISSLPKISDGEICSSDALHRASKLSEINKKRIKQSRPGGTWRDWDEELKVACHKKNSGQTYPSVYGRMKWDEPSPTITTQFYGYGNGRFGHPEQDRALSLREGAILQSFPSDYVFLDSEHPTTKHSLAMQIGNAVPVELGYAVGLSIKQHINEMIKKGK